MHSHPRIEARLTPPKDARSHNSNKDWIMFRIDSRVLVLVALAACGADEKINAPAEPVSVPTQAQANSLFTVSAPYGSTDARIIGDDGTPVTSVVYVALPEGSISDGVSVTVTAPDGLATGNIVNGGMDPIVVSARIGESLTAAVLKTDGQTTNYTLGIPAAGSPVVIRFSPLPNTVDIPLDATILVEFSEPIAAFSQSPAAIQLWQGDPAAAEAVPGQVAFGDSTRITMVFTPNALLDSATTYSVSLAQGIVDSFGMAIQTAPMIQFTTGDATSLLSARLRRRAPTIARR
jgi:Bacterial Ig-like domain